MVQLNLQTFSALRASIRDLTVTGTTTTLITETVVIEDNIIEVNLAPTTGAETAQTGGIQVNRGDGEDKALVIWDDTNDLFSLKKVLLMPNQMLVMLMLRKS